MSRTCLSSVRLAPLLALAFALPLAACSGEPAAQSAEVADLRADFQRLERESGRLKDQLATAERRIGGLEQDLVHVRELAVEVRAAPAPSPAAAAGGDFAPNSSAAPYAVPADAPAIAAFLASEQGRDAVAAAMKAIDDERSLQRTARMIDTMVDRFAKEAQLTEEQTKQMKDLLGKQMVAIREAWLPLRDGNGAELTQEERAAVREQTVAKVEEVRKQTDESLKSVLSQTQFEKYQQEEARLGGAARGFGGMGAGTTQGAGQGRRNVRNQGGQQDN